MNKRLYILAGANNGGTDAVLVAHGNGALNVVLRERYDKFMEGLCRK